MTKKTPKAKKCQRTDCGKEAVYKYKHDMGFTVYRCEGHMEKEYMINASHWF